MGQSIRLLPALIIVALGAIGLKAAGLAEAAGAKKPAQAEAETAAPAAKPSPTPGAHAQEAAQPAAAEPAAQCTTDARIAGEAGLTQDEFRILQALGARREQLEARETEIDTREKLVDAAGKKVETRVAELKKIEAQIQTLVDQLDAKQNVELDRLVKVYEKMKPKDAAIIFNDLDDPVVLDVAARVKDTTLSLILSEMRPDKARALTVALSRRTGDRAAAAARAAETATQTAKPPETAKPAPSAKQG